MTYDNIKVTEKQNFTLSLESTFLKNRRRAQIEPPPISQPFYSEHIGLNYLVYALKTGRCIC